MSLGGFAVADDWPRMLGPRDDGTAAVKLDVSNWADGLPLAWSIEVGEGYGNAVVRDGRMYHFDRYGDAERLTCYRLGDAQELWRVEFPVFYRDSFGYNNGPRAMPVVGEGVVAVFGVSGTLAVVDAQDGSVRWRRDTSEEYNVLPNFFGVGSTPAIYQGKLIAMVGGSPESESIRGIGRLMDREPGDSGLVAFDLADGREIYRVGGNLASYSAPVIQSIGGSDWCLALMREGLVVFDPSDGQIADRYPFRASINESVNAAWPLVSGDEVFISETYEIGSALLKFKHGKLRPVWTDPEGRREQAFRAHWATPVLVDGVLYGCSGRNEPDADLRAVRWADGKVLWTRRTHARSSVVAAGDLLINADENGIVQLIRANPKRFELLAEIDLLEIEVGSNSAIGTPVWAPPAIAEGHLILRGGHRLAALRLE